MARQLHDTGIDLDREAALLRYARHFELDDAELDHNGMLRQLIQGAAISEASAGLVPHRMDFPEAAAAPFRLNKSEQLVWLFDNAECRVGHLPSQPSPSITGVMTPGRTLPYYPPRRFVGRDVSPEGWESVATGQLAVTSERLHFRGPAHNIVVCLFVWAASLCTFTDQYCLEVWAIRPIQYGVSVLVDGVDVSSSVNQS